MWKKVKKVTSIHLSYFDYIKNIIRDKTLTPYQIQETIEKSWIDIIEEKLKADYYLLKHHSHKLSYLKLEAERTLKI